MMVEMMQPQPTDRICDPSCGTAGFLIESYDYLLRHHSSAAGTHTEVIDGEEHISYSGDQLGEHRAHVDADMFHAYDFDATMLRIATMNLVMHGVKQPDVHYQDTLSQSFEERHPKGSKDAFDLLIFSKNMTTNLHLTRYVFRIIAGECRHGAKAIERSGKEAVACRANAAKGQRLRRGCAGSGRGTPNRVHMEGAAR
jgi:hypothetical protein